MRTFPLAALLPVCLRFVRATCAPPLAALRPNRRSIRLPPSLDRNPPQPPRTIRFRSLNTRATWRFAPESLPSWVLRTHPPAATFDGPLSATPSDPRNNTLLSRASVGFAHLSRERFDCGRSVCDERRRRPRRRQRQPSAGGAPARASTPARVGVLAPAASERVEGVRQFALSWWRWCASEAPCVGALARAVARRRRAQASPARSRSARVRRRTAPHLRTTATTRAREGAGWVLGLGFRVSGLGFGVRVRG